MRLPRTELALITSALRGQAEEGESAKETDEERPVRWEENQMSERYEQPGEENISSHKVII